MSLETNPNADLDERIKASISSLKELVIIFTGITITAAFTFFALDHLSLGSNAANGITSLAINDQIGRDSLILVLLVLCVMRFYHGNIMILDRYYLMPQSSVDHERGITLDSIAILLMTFGLAFLGLLVQHFVWFFFVYVLITITSVFWLAQVNRSNFGRMLRNRGPNGSIPDHLHDELMTQMNWFIVNFVFLILIVLATVIAVMSSVGPILTHKDDIWMINFQFNETMFWVLSLLVLANSVWDLWANRKEYFPRKIS